MSVKLTEARQKAEEARKQIEAAQEALVALVKEAIEEGFQPLFTEYPLLGSIVWTQYTPYFNDGDPCVFHTSFTYPSINSVKDIEEGTACSCGDEQGEDFHSRASEEVYDGYDPETRRSKYKKSENYVAQYKECADAVYALVKALAGQEGRYGYDTPSNFDQALLRIFGDHVMVSVTRDGIEVDEYSHD